MMDIQIETTLPTPEEFIALREGVGWGRYDERSATIVKQVLCTSRNEG